MKTQLKGKIAAVYETIYCLLSFSFALIFGGKLLKTMWILLLIATYFFIGSFLCAILFTIAFAVTMIFIVILFVIGFATILSNGRD